MVIGLLQRKQALMYLKMEAPTVQTSWLKLSLPVMTERFLFLHDIRLRVNQEFNLLQNLNFGFQITALFLSVYSFSLAFIFLLNFMRKFIAQNTLRKPKFSLKQIVSSCLRITRLATTSPSLSIFILLFDLYLWLFMLMVINTTKTNKVVSIHSIVT